ncbi:MAG: prepilin peptidase [Turicibacter sp.]
MAVIIILLSSWLIGCLMNFYIYKLFAYEGYLTNKKNGWRNYIPFINLINFVSDLDDGKLKVRLTYMNLIHTGCYLLFFIKFGWSYTLLKYMIFSSILIVIGLIDLETKFVYKQTIVMGCMMSGVFILIEMLHSPFALIEYTVGAVVTYGFIYLIVKLTQGMGEGDAQIAGLCGLGLGIQGGIIVLFLGSILGALVGGSLLLLKMLTPKDEIAFGPFLVVGALICMLFQTEILNGYYSLFYISHS